MEQNYTQANLPERELSRSSRCFWPQWLAALRRWGVDGVAAAVLEAAGPFNLLAAQLAYLGQPLFSRPGPGGQWGAVAMLLENQTEAQAFAAFLREEVSR